MKLSLIVLVLFITLPNPKGQTQEVTGKSAGDLEWKTEKLDSGIYWKSYHGNDLYDSQQSINIVEVFLDSADVEFKIAFLPDSLMKTSEFAKKNRAVAAINGSFFRRDTGGSVVFLKVDDKVIFGGNPNKNHYNEAGGVGWSDNKSIHILKKPRNGWQNADSQTILSSGPLLVFNSETQDFKNDPFHQNRHPRTAVALTNDRRLYLVTVDGRSFQSYGMTIPELAKLLKKLGAENALNLDGGGSTSMWIKNMTENGVVNYPSDNLEFDHEGERQVSNALLILPSD